MKKKSELKISILILLIIFAISTISNFNFSDDQGNTDDSVEIRDETNLKSPKKSGAYSESFIHIDGNWSAATGKGWFSGDGSQGNPYVIENVSINAGGSGNGILINNSKNDYFIIRNCNVTNAGSVQWEDAGIKLYNTCNGTLTNNNCSNNGMYGIFLENSCENNTISGNTANNNTLYGIFLFTGCDDNIISGNTANNNSLVGIYLGSGCSYNNTISGNTANNNRYGIYLWNDCHNNTISGNTANNNTKYGITLSNNCHNNTISGNTVNNNTEYGISLLTDCDNNNITDNYIYFNTNWAIYINSADCIWNIIKRNVLVSSNENFIDDGGSGTLKKYNYYGMIPPSFVIEVIAQSFSTTEFIVTINISSQCKYTEVSDISFQMWWNGTLVPLNDFDDLGNNIYNISLTPILVEPGDNPILLNMTISALYHSDRYFEMKLSVDPEAVDKSPKQSLPGGAVGDDDDDDDDGAGDSFLIIILIVIIAGLAGAIGVIAILYKKKKARTAEL